MENNAKQNLPILSKFLIAILSVLFIANLLNFILFDYGIYWLIIVSMLIGILIIRNKFTWFLLILIFLLALFNVGEIRAIEVPIGYNILSITRALANINKSHTTIMIIEYLHPALYIFLFLMFMTRFYRVQYGISGKPKEWKWWNKIV